VLDREVPRTDVRFKDRSDAGRLLATRLERYANRTDLVVLALPRGGVPVAAEVARQLHAPLDVFLVRKLGVPGHTELAMGAIATGGIQVLNEDLIDELGITRRLVDEATVRERFELERRERLYRDQQPMLELTGRTVIVIDDGLATGSTMEAAVRALEPHRPARVVVAVPVGAPETCLHLQQLADEVVCVETPQPFSAVGLWYDRFDQVSDGEVVDLLRRARETADNSRRV
jgi:putative phosphoribosyl transferase